MFNLKITDNIKLSLEVSEDYLKNIIEEPGNVKNYKMLILNLHNSLELTFKFMLQSRNDFMIYDMQDSSSYRKVIDTYKSLHKQRKFSTGKILSEKGLPTVSFTKAYEILAYLYNVEEFDEKFIFKLKRINTLRNGLTHFEARVEHTDIIVLYNLFEECVNLYNSEIKSDRNAFLNLINDGNDEFIPNPDMAFEFSNAIENIKMELLDKPIIRELISFLIVEINSVNDIDLNDYEKICEFFLEKPLKLTPKLDRKEISKEIGADSFVWELLEQRKNREEENKKLIGRINTLHKESDKKRANSKEFLLEFIFLMLESDFMDERVYYDSFEIDIMSGISLTKSCKKLILKKWHSKNEICEAFKLFPNEYEDLLKFDPDHDHSDNSFDDIFDCRV
ncbi:hypothetical protein LSPCS325_51050 [Lysinibacillus sp. CTST325]